MILELCMAATVGAAVIAVADARRAIDIAEQRRADVERRLGAINGDIIEARRIAIEARRHSERFGRSADERIGAVLAQDYAASASVKELRRDMQAMHRRLAESSEIATPQWVASVTKTVAGIPRRLDDLDDAAAIVARKSATNQLDISSIRHRLSRLETRHAKPLDVVAGGNIDDRECYTRRAVAGLLAVNYQAARHLEDKHDVQVARVDGRVVWPGTEVRRVSAAEWGRDAT